ncbi:MAG: hypothetical protein ACTMUB_01720 [cyanobacterium endosymbiont of Rhopalodia musculus]|nr:hypothetical protein [cyanobacterium endosymbiont of Epithemia clementina EcSB]WGT66969.1 hypothetical protein P3F56_06930 [cyanobacterium endosymbiont of Epithemia clementina EcSB]
MGQGFDHYQHDIEKVEGFFVGEVRVCLVYTNSVLMAITPAFL